MYIKTKEKKLLNNITLKLFLKEWISIRFIWDN